MRDVGFSERVRWTLDYKRVAHRRQVLGADYRIRAWRPTGRDTLPVLFPDDRAIGDSTRIIAALGLPPLNPLASHQPRVTGTPVSMDIRVTEPPGRVIHLARQFAIAWKATDGRAGRAPWSSTASRPTYRIRQWVPSVPI